MNGFAGRTSIRDAGKRVLGGGSDTGIFVGNDASGRSGHDCNAVVYRYNHCGLSIRSNTFHMGVFCGLTVILAFLQSARERYCKNHCSEERGQHGGEIKVKHDGDCWKVYEYVSRVALIVMA